jgi:hypothetical protein
LEKDTSVSRGGRNETPLPDLALTPRQRVLVTERPVFRWQSVPGMKDATVYVVPDDPAEAPRVSKPVRGTEWIPEIPLRPGKTYQWSVSLRVAGKTSPLESRRILFGVMQKQQAEVLATLAVFHMKEGDIYLKARALDNAENAYRLIPPTSPLFTRAERGLREVERARKEKGTSK